MANAKDRISVLPALIPGVSLSGGAMVPISQFEYGTTGTLTTFRVSANQIAAVALSGISSPGYVAFANPGYVSRTFTGGTDITVTDGTGATNPAWNHNDSGVTSGTYGSVSLLPVITVNNRGHVTNVSTVNISAGGTLTDISITGTANQITVTSTSNPTYTSGSYTVSLPNLIDLTGKTVSAGTFISPTVSGGTLSGLTISGATITSSTVNASVIGGVVPAAGTFTTLGATVSAVISVNTASDALRITQIGAGNALVVEDSANPDATPFVITTEGRILTGHTATINFVNPANNTMGGVRIAVAGTSTNDLHDARAIYASTNTTVAAPYSIYARSNTTTVGAQAIASSGDVMGGQSWQASDGTNFIEAARVSAFVDGTPGTNDMPGRLVFSTTLDGASSPTERMRITNAGVITMGAAANAESFRVVPVASAVNSIVATGAATGNSPSLSVSGTTTTADLRLTPAATGYVFATAGGIKFPDSTIQTTAATGGGSSSLDVAQVWVFS